jgi:polysaccharide export outer membrane protein
MALRPLSAVLLAVASLVLGGCAGTGAGGAPPPGEDAEAPRFTESYEVGVGDALSVDVWKNPELSVAVPVRPDGRISMPLLGDVNVGGKSPEAVADEIEERLAEYVRDPQVSVIVTGVGSSEYLSRVRVTGAVQQPVSMPYRPGMTVMDVVLEAGGVNEFANPAGTRLYRVDEGVRSVDLKAILERGDLSTNYTLRPGDVVTIPQSVF